MLLVVIHDFCILNAIIGPPETYAPLIVDSDTVLISSRAFETLQAIAWRYLETVKVSSGMKLEQLPPCDSLYVPEPRHYTALKKSFSVPTGK